MRVLSGAEISCPLSVLESRYYGGFFLNKIYENCLGTLETDRNREESVLERCPYRKVQLYSFLICILFDRLSVLGIFNVYSQPCNQQSLC